MTEPFTFQTFSTRLRAFIDRAAPLLAQNDPLAQESADAEFNSLALELFTLQFENVPLYRRFCAARQANPKTVLDWPSIPALPVAAFKEADVTSLPVKERTTVFHSSGTTAEKPSRHWHSSDSLRVYEASLLPSIRHHLLGDRDDLEDSQRIRGAKPLAFLILTPSSALVPHSSLVHMFETARRELGMPDSIFTGRLDATGAWTLDIDQTNFSIREAISANRPLALLGTAFSFVHLLDHLVANDLRYRLPEGSRVLETGGYKGRSRSLPKGELHALITSHLGVPATHIVSEYGMSELSSQAYDRRIVIAGWHSSAGPRLFRFPPWARAQVISPETGKLVSEGEAGLLRIFDLANVRSVLALQTEDLGAQRGDGFELIGRAALAEPRGCSLMTP